jgi:hypothetical protein
MLGDTTVPKILCSEVEDIIWLIFLASLLRPPCSVRWNGRMLFDRTGKFVQNTVKHILHASGSESFGILPPRSTTLAMLQHSFSAVRLMEMLGSESLAQLKKHQIRKEYL